MSNLDDRRTLPGSDKAAVLGAHSMGEVNPSEQVTATIWLKSNPSPGSLHVGMSKIMDFCDLYGLAYIADEVIGKIDVTGTPQEMENAFGTRLSVMAHSGGTYRGRIGSLTLPNDIVDMVEAVLGLDDRPQAVPYLRRPTAINGMLLPKATHSYYTPPELARVYQAPSGDGSGRCIAIISLGGGIVPADLQSYFTAIGVSPIPKISLVLVDGAQNKPDGPNGADGENCLDIETAGGFAPGASIVLYLAPNTDRGFADAISAAINDSVNKPDVISISWGSSERAWTTGARKVMDALFQTAAAAGITVTAAAGDDGSSDGMSGNNVDFPASSPYVLGCGGTRLVGNPVIASETVWNSGSGGGATGGGFSAVYSSPSYQANNSTLFPSRGVPDVAAVADPATGIYVRVDGQMTVIGGTSAAAPLWAGMIARLCSTLGRRVGFINPTLYSLSGKGCRDVTQGSNGAFNAKQGWDACTGWGSPIGTVLVDTLGGSPSPPTPTPAPTPPTPVPIPPTPTPTPPAPTPNKYRYNLVSDAPILFNPQ